MFHVIHTDPDSLTICICPNDATFEQKLHFLLVEKCIHPLPRKRKVEGREVTDPAAITNIDGFLIGTFRTADAGVVLDWLNGENQLALNSPDP